MIPFSFCFSVGSKLFLVFSMAYAVAGWIVLVGFYESVLTIFGNLLTLGELAKDILGESADVATFLSVQFLPLCGFGTTERLAKVWLDEALRCLLKGRFETHWLKFLILPYHLTLP